MKGSSRIVLADIAYEHIKDQILKKEINCGDRINEQLLESTLNMSRTPIREAIRRLSTEGLLILVPNRYAEVISFSDESIHDLGVVRITMDCLAAQFAIQNGSNKDFSNLKELADKCAFSNQEGDWFNQIKYDCEFHLKLIEISENKVLYDIQKNIMLKTRLLQTSRVNERSASLPSCNIKQHEVILNALFERDSANAIKAIKKHLAPFYSINDEILNMIPLS